MDEDEDDGLEKEILEDPEFAALWSTLEQLFLEAFKGADRYLRLILSNPRSCQLFKIVHLFSRRPISLTDGRKC